MKLGDIVWTDGQLWKVTFHSSEYRTLTLASWSGSKIEVPDTPVDGVRVVHTPQDWPFMALPMRASKGRILNISRNGEMTKPLDDWVPSGMISSGGSIFFNPALRLRPGEILLIHHERGVSKAKVKFSFMNTKDRKRLAEKPYRPRRPKTAYGRLSSDDDFDFDMED